MSRHNGKPPEGGSYQVQLRQAMIRFLPSEGLALLAGGDKRVRWTDRLLVVCAILIAWDPGTTLLDRFSAARECVVKMFPGRRRPGATYEGFIAALVKVSQRLLELVAASLRESVRQAAVAGGCWEVAGWVAFGADGSKIDCPMTRANEVGLGVASRKNSWPQMLLTTLFHAGSGLPWALQRGGAKASERGHLLRMLCTLPLNALLVADAGFTGYDLLEAIIGSGRSFLIRVGSNVHLLTRLGYAVEERDGLVYLWPERKQKNRCKPLVLRLITFIDGRNRRIHLLTDVLEPGRLCDGTALVLYRLRWGVELLYRSLKQTLGRRKMLSDCPEHAAVELDWAVLGLWMLDLMNAHEAGLSVRRSCASALRAVRAAISGRGRRGRRRHGTLAAALARATGDGYRRRGSKKARHWPHKKKDKPPGDPKARNATEAEVQLAQEIQTEQAANSLAA